MLSPENTYFEEGLGVRFKVLFAGSASPDAKKGVVFLECIDFPISAWRIYPQSLQVSNNHILTQNPYHICSNPKPKYLIIRCLGPLGP